MTKAADKNVKRKSKRSKVYRIVSRWTHIIEPLWSWMFFDSTSRSKQKKQKEHKPKIKVGVGFSLDRVKEISTCLFPQDIKAENDLFFIEEPIIAELFSSKEETIFQFEASYLAINLIAGRVATINFSPYLRPLSPLEIDERITTIHINLFEKKWVLAKKANVQSGVASLIEREREAPSNVICEQFISKWVKDDDSITLHLQWQKPDEDRLCIKISLGNLIIHQRLFGEIKEDSSPMAR